MIKNFSKELVIYSNANLQNVINNNKNFIISEVDIPQETKIKRAKSFEAINTNIIYENGFFIPNLY